MTVGDIKKSQTPLQWICTFTFRNRRMYQNADSRQRNYRPSAVKGNNSILFRFSFKRGTLYLYRTLLLYGSRYRDCQTPCFFCFQDQKYFIQNTKQAQAASNKGGIWSIKKEDIIDALGSVDEKFLIEAQTYRNRSNPSYRPFYSAWTKNATLCLLLLFAAIYLFDFQINKKPALQQPKSLPKISLDDHPAGSFGYPAFEYFSPSDIVDGNPWEKTSALTSLPVFQNTLSHDDKYKVSGYSLHHMKDELYAVAERLNINQTKLHVQQNITPYYAWVQADTDAYEITVSQDMVTQISFKSANLLPYDLRSLSLDCYENNVKIAA